MRHHADNGVEGRIAIGGDLKVEIRDATVFGWIASDIKNRNYFIMFIVIYVR